VLATILVWAANFLLVGRPIHVAHYNYYVDPSTLVLDLREANAVAPVDLFRAIFQSARSMHEAGRTFSSVILARSHSTVFLIDGDAFAQMGRAFEEGENPVYLIRTLPVKLANPDGTPAFGTWTGGLLGVLTHQMDDANSAARQWASGR
jgi:hypothetical protein